MIFALYLLVLVLVLAKPIEAFAPGLAEYRVTMVMSLLVFAIAVAGAVRTGEMAVRTRHLVLLAGLMVAIVLSQAMQGWLGGASQALTEFLPSALLFLTTAMVVTTTRRLKATCGLIVLCLLILAIASIAAYHTGFMAEDLIVREGGGAGVVDYLDVHTGMELVPADDASGQNLWRVRSWGFFNDPNDFSQAIVMCIPMLLGAWLARNSLRNLLRIWLPFALFLYTIYLTHSRGAMLGLGMMLMYGLLSRAGVVKASMALATFAMIGIITGATGGRGYSSSEESAGGRIAAWSDGLEMLRSNPLFGVGYGNFTEHFPYTAHNSFVLGFSELGLFGYFFWIALLVLAFKEMTRAVQITHAGMAEHRWSMMLRISLLGFMTCAMFLSRTYSPTLYVLLALCFSSLHCAEKAVLAEGQAQLPPVRWMGTVLLALPASIAAIYLVVRVQNALG